VDGTTPRAAVHVDAQDVGSRVVLRYRLDPREHGPAGETLTDVMGELLEWSHGAGGTATVRRASGEQVTVELARLVAGKVIPPAPGRKPG
jgi:hypothetical protein